MLTVTNNSAGGQPVSMDNVRQVGGRGGAGEGGGEGGRAVQAAPTPCAAAPHAMPRPAPAGKHPAASLLSCPPPLAAARQVSALCKRHGIPLFIDAARFAGARRRAAPRAAPLRAAPVSCGAAGRTAGGLAATQTHTHTHTTAPLCPPSPPLAAENCYFIQRHEPGFEHRPIVDIARELFSYADGCTFRWGRLHGAAPTALSARSGRMPLRPLQSLLSPLCALPPYTPSLARACAHTHAHSGKKEALANVGGLLCCNDDALYEQVGARGGLSRRSSCQLEACMTSCMASCRLQAHLPEAMQPRLQLRCDLGSN